MLRWERIHVDFDAWDQMLEAYPERTLFQSARWLKFLQDSVGGEIVFAVLRDGAVERGRFVGMIIKRLGFRILGSPLPGWTTSYMGFVLTAATSRLEAVNELKRFAFETLKCVHMELMDRHMTSGNLDSQYRFRHYDGFELDLSQSEDQLFANFFPACKRCIRKASRCGVLVEEASDAEFAIDYYEQLRDVFRKQGLSPTYTLDRVRKMIAHLQPEGNLLLLRARDSNGRAIATGIFPAMNDRAYFWGGASWRQDQQLRPNESLMWHAIRYWKSRGIGYFDFGGSGDYKRKFGAREISVPWLRVSRYPFLPAMRNAVAVMTHVRQRLHGALQSDPSAPGRRQYGQSTGASVEAIDA